MSRDPGWKKVRRNLLDAELDWQIDATDQHLYHASFGDATWLLRINDFPDKVLFSLFRGGELMAEFDDRPSRWRFARR